MNAGIPTVRDRVVQTALRAVVEPIFEREFAPQSYGFRPGRGCKDGLRRVDELLESGHVHVVDIDIKGKPDAGKPPVRFGGRGGELHPRSYPDPGLCNFRAPPKWAPAKALAFALVAGL